MGVEQPHTRSLDGAHPLANVRAGDRVQLVDVQAGHGLRLRLAAMGLVPGTVFSVITNSLWGPLIIAVRGTRLILGRGMADRVVVRGVTDNGAWAQKDDDADLGGAGR